MAAQMLQLMVDWKNEGGSRLDTDNDGLIDAPGAAVMDGSWTNIANAFMKPRLGTQLTDELNTCSRGSTPSPPASTGQYSGWYQYFDRDVNTLLGKKVPSPLQHAYCGKGKLEAVPAATSGTRSSSQARRSPPSRARGSVAVALGRDREQIHFSPLPLKTMRYTNRPSGIQQVISFDGHRKNK